MVSVDTLLKKSGSASPRRVFRAMLREMIGSNHLPDYEIAEEPGDRIRFSRRDALVDGAGQGPALSPAALEEARGLLPGADVYALEAEWRAYWRRTGQPRLRSADAAFLGFVKRKAG